MPTGSLLEISLVALGGVLGALSRYGITLWVKWMLGPPPPGSDHFPYAVLGINVTGCFAIGYLFPLVRGQAIPPEVYYGLTAGFLGAFTTFSAFGLDTVDMVEKQDWGGAIANVIFSLVLGFAAVCLGMWLGRMTLNAVSAP